MDSFKRYKRALGRAILIGILTIGTATPLHAESARPSSSRSPDAIPVGTIGMDTDAEDEYKPDDDFYTKYCAPIDGKIQTDYRDQWHYQESQLPYLTNSWSYEHLSIGSLNGINPQYEWDVRNRFAQQVLRMRTDMAMRTYFASNERAQGIKHAQRALNNVKNYQMRLSNDGASSARLNVGYDLFTDSLKVEYFDKNFNAGLYQPHLISTLGSVQSTWDALSLRLSQSFGEGLPTAFFCYWLNGSAFQTGVSKDLSRTVSTQILSFQPLQANVPHSYQWFVSYRF